MAKQAFNNEETKRPGAKEVNRGTQDEIEIIMMIVAQVPGLKMQVLEKIRQTKYRLGISKKPTGDANAAKKKPT